MKIIFTAMMLVFVLILAGCADEQPTPPVNKDIILMNISVDVSIRSIRITNNSAEDYDDVAIILNFDGVAGYSLRCGTLKAGKTYTISKSRFTSMYV